MVEGKFGGGTEVTSKHGSLRKRNMEESYVLVSFICIYCIYIDLYNMNYKIYAVRNVHNINTKIYWYQNESNPAQPLEGQKGQGLSYEDLFDRDFGFARSCNPRDIILGSWCRPENSQDLGMLTLRRIFWERLERR